MGLVAGLLYSFSPVLPIPLKGLGGLGDWVLCWPLVLPSPPFPFWVGFGSPASCAVFLCPPFGPRLLCCLLVWGSCAVFLCGALVPAFLLGLLCCLLVRALVLPSCVELLCSLLVWGSWCLGLLVPGSCAPFVSGLFVLAFFLLLFPFPVWGLGLGVRLWGLGLGVGVRVWGVECRVLKRCLLLRAII